MPTKKLGNDAIEDAEIIDVTYTDDSDIEKNIDEEVNFILSELGSDIKQTKVVAKIYKRVPNSANMDWCVDVSPQELEGIMEDLRDEYGPGTYCFRLYVSGKFKKAIERSIAAPIGMQKIRGGKHRKNSEEISGGGNVLQAVVDMQRRFDDKLTEISSRNDDRFERLLLAMQGSQQQQPISMLEMVQTMQVLKELSGPGEVAKPVNPLSQLKEVSGLLKELTEDIGGGGGEKNMASVLEKFAPAIIGSIEKMNEAPSNTQIPTDIPQRPHLTPQPVKMSPRAKVSNPSPKESPEMLAKMKFQKQLLNDVNRMVVSASKGGDAGLWVDLILDQYDFELVKETAFDPDVIDKMAMFVDGVNDYRPWFDELKEILIQAVTESESDTTNEEMDTDDNIITGDVSTSTDNSDINSESTGTISKEKVVNEGNETPAHS